MICRGIESPTPFCCYFLGAALSEQRGIERPVGDSQRLPSRDCPYLANRGNGFD